MNLITHEIDSNPIPQRVEDGYVNLTKMVKAGGKLIADYLRSKQTKGFLNALSTDMGIPISALVSVSKGGTYLDQGTWAHPQVAIHCAQWCSPEFAVLVTKWVLDWMSKGTTPVGDPPKSVSIKSDVQIHTSTPTTQTIDVTPVAAPKPMPAFDPKEKLAFIKEGFELLEMMGGADPRHRIMLKDQVMNAVMADKILPPKSTVARGRSKASALAVQENAPTERVEYPITDRCAELGYRPDQYKLLDIGRKVAKLYKQRHGEPPVKREQFVGGTTRMVNVYSGADLDILDEAIKAVMG